MAARKTPSAGAKPDKLMRDALILELNRETENEEGKKVKRYRRIAANLAKSGENGKLEAIKEIFDRIDGRPMQAVQAEVQGEFIVKWES